MWRTLVAAFALLCCASLDVATAQNTNRGVLRITQLDVGQGDAALIVTPEGKRILIDAGRTGHTAADLLQQGIDTLDLVVASHNHADHIGGMPDVFAAFVVRAYMDNGLPHTTNVYRRTLLALEQEDGLQYLQATDRVVRVGTVTLRILPPPPGENSQNNGSVGLLLEYGKFRALYTGDSEQSELRTWLQEGRIPDVTLLKAAHHGSWNGITAEWVKATSPKIVLISVGGRNRYGHPAIGVVQTWLATSARVYRTDRDGTVVVTALLNGDFTVRTSSDTSAGRP